MALGRWCLFINLRMQITTRHRIKGTEMSLMDGAHRHQDFNNCLRCRGSGIDPVDSTPATFSEGSYMEPAVLEPCRVCVIPTSEEQLGKKMASCPYYQGTGGCINGCWDEPRCVTEEPEDGWLG